MTTSVPIQLVVGLGNPGADYVLTRHNAGFWFVDALARAHGGSYRHERKFSGEVCRIKLDGHELRLLKPDTYMNRSGQAVQAMAAYLKLPSQAILVAHDDLDLPVGSVRLKQGGGHGGHNGLGDVIQHLGEDFPRLRFGIGRPPSGADVIDYVLQRASEQDQSSIMEAVGAAITAMPLIAAGSLEKAMQQLHSRGVEPRRYRKDSAGHGSGNQADGK
ncbi:MAG: aminoacyl-tRNA hydrolase [Gammaproteobacteria bacterium]|nr:aminoacyl-tRNA hydrolase [Gammaproteobacteria bacterium]MDE2345956.1 aminoacyl-tRNA hydrolase [Gammaproteobacteria bacterium]